MRLDNIKTLDTNQARKKRGRPEHPLNVYMRREFPKLSSPQSINNRRNSFSIGTICSELGLLDSEYRDKETGKRIATKLAVLGRNGGISFFETDEGKQWLLDNWQIIIAMTTAELIAWRKEARIYYDTQ